MNDVTPRDRKKPRLIIFSVLRILAVALGLTLVYALIPLEGDHWWLGTLISVAAIVAIAPFTVHRVRAVRTTDRPTLVAIEALTMQFAMLVFGFSSVYLVVNRSGTQFADMNTKLDAAYFTVTTLSTVGFGDVHAIGQAARFAVILQVIVDFTLLAVAVRLLLNATKDRLGPGPRLTKD